jgi:hypothetical protein
MFYNLITKTFYSLCVEREIHILYSYGVRDDKQIMLNNIKNTIIRRLLKDLKQ